MLPVDPSSARVHDFLVDAHFDAFEGLFLQFEGLVVVLPLKNYAKVVDAWVIFGIFARTLP